jgi:hypothetical protein
LSFMAPRLPSASGSHLPGPTRTTVPLQDTHTKQQQQQQHME